MSWNPLNWIPWGNGVGSVDDLSSEQADIQRREAELDARAKAKYGESWSEQVQKHRAEEYAVSYEAQVGDAFVTGAQEGAATMQAAIRKGIASPIDWIAGSIPWQVWLLAAVAAFWYLGGFVYLRGIMAKGAK